MTDPVERLRRRLQLAAWTAFVAVLPWVWRSGAIAPDTKIDLVVSPWRYLMRATGAWDVHSGFGQLQNQAYGYLMPMGPVFGVARSLELPEWSVQRLWWSLLLVVAFLGVERLLRMLGTPFGFASVLPALAYALSPRVLTVISEISVEAWPMAVCPWLLVVVVAALRDGTSPRALRRLAGRTGLLVAVIGGVNATASMVVLVAPLLLLLTAPRGSRRPTTVGWWSAGVVLGSLWWLLPLLVTGRYAYPFLDYIENASVTTSVTSVGNVLRGGSHWVAYVTDAFGRPVWQSGWTIAQEPAAILATSAVAALGLAGLLSRRAAPQHGAGEREHVRRFAFWSLLVGVLIMGLGYGGSAGGPFADEVRRLLDGPLAPFRNVHKADPLVRLPLVIGLSWLLQLRPGAVAAKVWSELPAADRTAVVRRWTAVTAAVVVAVAALPVLQGRVVSAGAFDQLPRGWRQTARVVDAMAEKDGGSTLLLPGSGTADYVWGRPEDEPLSALARSPVVVRNDVPLGTPGSTRILDVVDLQAASGHRQSGLAEALARMGVARVVVRGDLALTAQAQDAEPVERTLERSPGFRPVDLPRPARRSLSLWEVAVPRTRVVSYAVEDAFAVGGGPEAVPLMTAAGLDLDGRALLVGEDAAPFSNELAGGIATDTLRRRLLNPGRSLVSHYSPTLDASASVPPSLPAPDLPPGDGSARQTVRQWLGLESVEASDDAATPFGIGYRSIQHGAHAAVDGDVDTAWLSSGGDPTARLTLRFPDQVPTTTLHLVLAEGDDVAPLSEISVVAGELEVRPEPVRRSVSVPLAGATGDTVEIRLRRDPVEGNRGEPFGLAEVGVEGVQLGSALVAVTPSGVTPTAFLLTRDPLARLDPARRGEEGASLVRIVRSLTASLVDVTATVTGRDGSNLRRIVTEPWSVAASSLAGGTSRNWPGAALDSNPETSWVARADDLAPTLQLQAEDQQEVRGLTLTGGSRRRVLGVVVRSGGETFRLPPEGGSLPILGAKRLTITFEVRPNLRRFVSPDVTLTGPDGIDGQDTLTLACGQAGTVQVGDTSVPLQAEVARLALGDGSAFEATPCGDPTVALPSGEVGVVAQPAEAALVQSVLLTPAGLPAAAPAGTAEEPEVERWAADHRSIDVPPGPRRIVALDEGFNDGWRAELADGRELPTVRVDGWRQGFVVPEGEGGRLVATFAPDRWYRGGLLVGAVGVAVALVLAAAGWRRRRPTGTGAAQRVAAHPGRVVARPGQRPTVRLAAKHLLPGAVGLLLGGPWGLLVGLLTGFLPLRALAASAGGALVLAGLCRVLVAPSAGEDVGAQVGQLLALLALSCVAVAVASGDPAHHRALDGDVGERRDRDR